MLTPEMPAQSGRPRGGIPRWFQAIRARIFLSMALPAALLLALVALTIEGQARRELEQELTLRLQAVGTAAVSLIGPGVVPALVNLAPVHSEFRFYQDRRSALIQLRDRTGVRRIFLADTTGRSFVDTDPRVEIGASMPQLRSDLVEMREVRRGKPAAAALFTDADGQPRKTGYVPVILGDKVIGLVGVEADATFLSALRALRIRILAVGAAGLLLALLLAAPVSRGLTRPIHELVGWARHLGRGDLSHPVPVRGRDEIALLAGTLEQMRVRLEARDREQRAMVAGVAHEIRNPLGGIRLYAELLDADPEMGQTSRGRLTRILRELGQLEAIVQEFLLYARPAVPEPQKVALGELLQELTEWIAPEATRRGVALVTEVQAGAASPAVEGDPVHLRQIFRNLIQNAVDASPPGSEVCVRAPGASVARVEIDDAGPGIPEEDRERVFEPFFTTKATGAGLGLPIVRRLALLNGARVEVGSAPAGGARFTVLFDGGRD